MSFPCSIKILFVDKDIWILHHFNVPYQRRQWHPTPVLLPGKSHGWRSLVGGSPWGCWGSDTTERLHFHFSLSCIGEGNGNPLQRSCLENPRDRGAWWAAVYAVAQSWTRLKWLSSSSSTRFIGKNAKIHWALSFCKVLFQALCYSSFIDALSQKYGHHPWFQGKTKVKSS